MSGINIPTCLWAQTKEAVYVTVDVPDVTDEKISVDANVLKFSAKSGGKQYECTMELFEPINAEESKYEVRGRNVFFSLKRAESEEEKDEVLNEVLDTYHTCPLHIKAIFFYKSHF